MLKYIYAILLAILVGLIIVELSLASCIEISNKTYDRAIRWGYEGRIVKGVNEYLRPHQWVEYWNNKHQEWCVWDDAVWYVGKSRWTAIELGYITLGG